MEKARRKKPNLTRLGLVPHPPPDLKADSTPPKTYRTAQLRKGRFKKQAACRSAPPDCTLEEGRLKPPEKGHAHSETDLSNWNSTSELIEDSQKNKQVQFETGDILACAPAQDNLSLATASSLESSQQQVDPILSYITSVRVSFGLEVKPERNPTEGERESMLTTAGPIAGIKDLKRLSRNLLNLQSAQGKLAQRGDFVYCLRRDMGSLKERYNPYNLEIVSLEQARAQGKYFTVSAFSVTEVHRSGGGMDLTAVQRWLWERDMFYRLLAIPFFARFKLWRAFITWKKWISNKKLSEHKSLLCSSLFSADVLLQKAILQVRYLCEAASSSASSSDLKAGSSRGVSLIEVDIHTTYTLGDFMALQERKGAEVRERLAVLREEVVSVVFSACQIVADNEGLFGLVEVEADNKEPSHAEVLEWRMVLERLERFVRLCNCLVLELLQRLVMTAVCTLEHCIERAGEKSASLAKQQRQEFQKMREQVLSQPYTQSVLDRHIFDVEEEGGEDMVVKTVSFNAFMPPEGSFDLLMDNQSSTSSVTDDNEDQPCGSQDPQDMITLLLQKPPDPVLPLWVVKLHLKERLAQDDEPSCHLEGAKMEGSTKGPSFEVSFSPNADDFSSAFVHLLEQYVLVISNFTSLVKDDKIRPYTSRSRYDLLMILEEESSKKTSAGKPHPWPDTHSILHQYTPYQSCVGYIENKIQSTISEIEAISTHYQCFTRMVEICCSADINASTPMEEWSVSDFQRAFALYHDQVHAMEGMGLSFQVGMVRVEVGDFKDSCLAHPQAILRQLQYHLPNQANNKSDDLVRKIMVATDRLLSTPTNVEGFMHFLNSVEEVTAMIPSMEKQLQTITHLYNVAQEFAVTVAEEQMALYKAAFPQLRYLKNLLVQAEATKSESVYQFSTDLKAQVSSLLKEAMEIRTNIESPGFLEEQTAQQSLEQLSEYEAQLKRLIEQARSYVEYHQHFGSIRTSKRHYYSLDTSSHSWSPEEVYEEVLRVQQSLEVRQSLLHAEQDWNHLVERWETQPLAAINVGDLQKQINNFLHTLDYLEKGFSSNNKLLTGLKEKVVSFCSHLPTLSCLLNPALKIRHYEAIECTIGGHIGSRDTLTITQLREMKVFDHHYVISEVSKQANNEATLDSMLKKVTNEWVSQEFTLLPYTGVSGRQTHLLGGVDDLLASLEDSLTTLNTIKSSKYVSPIKHAVLDWESRLSLVADVVDQWMLCQKNWLYLESIFSTADIQRQLSSEAKLFFQADKSWREVIRLVGDKPTALRAASTPGVLEAFQGCGVLLEQVFKSLEDYLEAKRLAFPRLYFISDNELLDMLAHVKNPLAVQPYLSKLFGNIKRLVLLENVQISPPISAMVSAEGEMVELPKNLYARGSPEQWLGNLEKAMFGTVRTILRQGVVTYDSHSRSQWALDHPGQVVLTVTQIDWTQRVESCLQGDSVQEQLRFLNETWLDHLENLAHLTADRDLPSVKHNVITALLTLDVHCRDVIQSLLSSTILSVNDFEWVRHLRHYWQNKSSSCTLQQCYTTFQYGNEYLGCLPRLVVTPLSERCYLTLTTALHLHLGGSPIGPAGTGKSESVKDLAKAMGKLCLVFNCSEGLNYKMMSRFFSGLCQSGIWCCFDEFNRIDVEVLSVIAQQLQSIKAAKDAYAIRFIFEGREVKLIPTCAVFITMNPGYAGRVELPDNLKSLFRPVAMMVPDTAIIVKVLLYTSGFTNAPSLAVKLTKLYQMAEMQLSHQLHYDFGLRSVKAVVLLARDYLKKERRNDTTGTVEKKALLQALQDSELSKLLSSDAQVMNMLLWDLFKVDIQETPDDILKGYLGSAAEENRLQSHHGQLLKCIQLYNAILVRHGVVVLGPTGSGKSTVLKLLREALNNAYEDFYGHKRRVVGNISFRASLSLTGSISEFLKSATTHCQLMSINPKSISLEELYGCYNPLSLEWKIGVLAKILQTYSHHTEMEIQTSNKTAPENGGKNTDETATEAGSSSAVDYSESSTELLDHQLGLSHSTIGDNGGEDSFSERVPNDSPTGMPYPSCAPVGWKWVILDGPVDPGWVENLNSALDDSKLLCLANGERIQLFPGMRILFETDDLSNASPATVSRCGMVYMDVQDLGWRPYVLSWMKNLPKEFPDEGKQHLLPLFDHSVDKGIVFLKDHASELSCPVPVASAVATLCHILLALLEHVSNEYGGFGPSTSSPRLEAYQQAEESSSSLLRQTLTGIYIPTKQHQSKQKQMCMKQPKSQSSTLPFLHCHPERLCDLIGKLFVFSFAWAFGGCFEQVEETDLLKHNHAVTRGGSTGREQFDALVHNIFTSNPQIKVQLPTSADLIYSYYVDISTCSFAPWKKLVPSAEEIAARTSMMQKGFQHLSTLSSSSFIDLKAAVGQLCNASEVGFVPTTKTVQLCFLILLLYRNDHNVILSSKMGAGKTHLLKYLTKLFKSGEQCADILSAVLGRKKQAKQSVIHLSSSALDTEDEKSPVIGLPLHMSPQTETSHLQSEIEGYLVRKDKSTFAPPAGKKVLAYLDDLNMAAVDTYGSQPCSELLRQLMNDGGWYDRKYLTWKVIKGVGILATAGQKGWSCSNIKTRYLRKFSLLCLPEPSSVALTSIFSTHIKKHFMSVKFPSEVLDCISQLVSCAIYVYKEARAQLLPSPGTPQYIFCIRDLSKAFTGLLRVQHRGLHSKDDAIHLLCHELLRVFNDRCLSQDRNKFLEILSEALRIYFKVVQSPTQLKEQLYLYEDMMDPFRGYSAVKSTKKLVKHLERVQSQYNIAKDKSFQLVFFPLACEHILRATRVLKQPGGHLLMLGMGSVGRRSYVQLASYIAGCKYQQLTPGYQHSTSETQEDLKPVLLECGVKNQPFVLLVSEDIGEQDMLFHYLHELMVCGEVAGLFDKDEMEGITSQLTQEETPNHTTKDSEQQLWDKFVQGVRHNLHIVLCFSPTSPLLVQLCKTYPGLVTHATVNVCDEWPAKALYGVAVKELHSHSEMPNSSVSPLIKEMQHQVTAACVKIHISAVSASHKVQDELHFSFSVTPSSFIHLVHTFCKILSRKQKAIDEKRSHLEVGLHHLGEAEKRVVLMKSELEQLQPEIHSKAQEVESLLHQLSAEQQEVNLLRAAVAQEKEDVARETEHVATLAKEAEEDLQSVLPALEEAERGLNALKKTDLVEIRSYGTPPSMVMHVMSSVCVLLQQPTDWDTVKHLMSDPIAFLKTLTTFDKDNAPDKVIKIVGLFNHLQVFSKLKRYTSVPNFSPSQMAQYSVACQSFCQWVLAIEHYGGIHRVVEPKRKMHKEISNRLEAVRSKLAEKEDQLKELECQLQELQDQYSMRVSERDALVEKCEEITIQLRRAEVLTTSLGDEQIRWQETLHTLCSRLATLTGDSLLTAACLVYWGPFTPSYRQPLLAKWKHFCQENKLSVDPSFSTQESLMESEEIQEWYVQGLPKDTHSIQNAAVITHCERWPLIMDTEGQATRWLKCSLRDCGLMVVPYGSSHLLKVLEQGVRAGLPVLVENVPEQFSAILDPFLVRATMSSQGQLLLRVGKTEIEYNSSFRLFLVCRQREPKLPSDICTKTTVINFSATFDGLQDQLLSLAISLEEPTLEMQYSGLLLSIASDKRELKALEQKLLEMLESVSGSILASEELIVALQQVKQVSTEVEERLSKAQQTKDKLTASRHKYQPVATRGSILYFSVLALKHLSPMYQFSVEWFQEVFSQCIQANSADSKDDDRFRTYLVKVIQQLTSSVCVKVSVALDLKFHLAFVLKICCSILMHGDEILEDEPTIRKEEWLALVQGLQLYNTPEGFKLGGTEHGGLAPLFTAGKLHSKKSIVGHKQKHDTSFEKQTKLERPDFLSQEMWDAALTLERLAPSIFINLQQHILANVETWTSFINSPLPWEFKFKPINTEIPTTSRDSHKPSSNPKRKKFSISTTLSPATLTPFQRLLLIRTFHPNRFVLAVQMFIQQELGPEYIAKPPLDLRKVFEESSCSIPVLFILAQGTDPMASLLQLAKQVLPTPVLLDSVSLGQGQGERAKELTMAGAHKGRWVFLQNCHLSSSWMPELEAVFKSLQANEVHPEFRLWLSSKPTTAFPSNILQSSIKISLEPPQSLKSNLQQLLSSTGTSVVSKEAFEQGGGMWRQLIFGLCMFHAVVIGRKKYGAVGWNAPYQFSSADLQVTLQLLQSVLTSHTTPVPWVAIKHLAGEICYGGRITNTQDIYCLRALLERFCNPEKLEKGRLYLKDHPVWRPTSTSAGYSECCFQVENLPVDEPPELYGLHSSQESMPAAVESGQLQSSLYSIEFPVESQSLYIRSHDRLVLERSTQLLEQLPTHIKLPAAVWTAQHQSPTSSPPFQSHSQPSPYWILLSWEVSHWNHRLSVVSTTLSHLIAAVKGEAPMLEEDEALYQSLVAERVPKAWQLDSSDVSAISITKWFEHFTKCYNFIAKWASMNTSANQSEPKLPSAFWLAALTSPKGLFAAVTQDFSRKSDTPLETVVLKYRTVSPEVSTGAITLSGLRLEGAQWSQELGLIATTGKQCCKLDLMCCPVQISSEPTEQEYPSYYECPLYLTPARRHFITSFSLPTNVQPDHWTMQKVALFTVI